MTFLRDHGEYGEEKKFTTHDTMSRMSRSRRDGNEDLSCIPETYPCTLEVTDECDCYSLRLPASLRCQNCCDYLPTLFGKNVEGAKSTKCDAPFKAENKTHTLSRKRDHYENIHRFLEERRTTKTQPLASPGPEDESLSSPSHSVGAGATHSVGARLMTTARAFAAAVLPSRIAQTSLETPVVDDPAVNLFPNVPAVTEPKSTNKKRNYIRYFKDIVVSGGKYIVKGVPNNCTVIETHLLEGWKAKAAKYDSIVDVVAGRKKFSWNDHGKRHLAAGLMEIPYASFYGVSQFIPSLYAGLFAASNIPLGDGGIEPEAIARNSPSEQALQRIVMDGAADCLLWMQSRLSKAEAVFLGADKGKRGGIDHLAKVLSWFEVEDGGASNMMNGRVHSIMLDMDGSEGTSKLAAEAINHSLNKVRPGLKCLNGQTTDSGGGGTLESFARELCLLQATDQFLYVVIGCALHALQLGFANGIKAAFGEGGLGKHNLMQLIHCCYDLQECVKEPKLRHLFWEIATESPPPEKMSTPVLTRWWHVNVAAMHLLENWNEWGSFADAMLADTTANTKQGKIASSLSSLLEEDALYIQLQFICAFSKAFFVPNMECLQAHDPVAKDFGYRSRDMPLRAFLIIQKIENLALNWSTHPNFQEFCNCLNNYDEQAMNAEEGLKATQAGVRVTFLTAVQIREQVRVFFQEATTSY
jgi:hypothetical protein